MYRPSLDGQSDSFSPHEPSFHNPQGSRHNNRGRQEIPRETFDELDEIQEEFEALTRWTRQAELARLADAQVPTAPASANPLVAGGQAAHPSSGSSGRDWRDILQEHQPHARVDSDASVEDMDFASYSHQLRQQQTLAASTRSSYAGRLATRPSFASQPSGGTPISPAPSYTSRFPPNASSPSIRSYESYRARPTDDYDLPVPCSQASHEPFHSELFDTRATHHLGARAHDNDDDPPTRQALKSFPKFSRDWFKGDGKGYRGVGEEMWEGGFTGDLADGLDPSEVKPTSPAATKKARIERLEREFGIDAGNALKGREISRADFMQGQPLRVGDMDKKGRIITDGPRKRSILRWVEGLLSLLTTVLLVYSALFLKDLSPTPPPQSTMPAYALYAWSSVALIAVVILHVIYPLACLPRARKRLAQQSQHPSGGMILPMAHPGGGKPKKGGRHGHSAPMAINLVVDPAFFTPASSGYRSKRDRRRDRRRRGSVSFSSSASSDDEAKPNTRAFFSDVLAQRQQFSLARRWLVKLAWFDGLLGLGWGAVFGFAMTDPTCAPGTSEGWCDCWNSALAFAALLALSFLASSFFGWRDRKIQLRLHT